MLAIYYITFPFSLQHAFLRLLLRIYCPCGTVSLLQQQQWKSQQKKQKNEKKIAKREVEVYLQLDPPTGTTESSLKATLYSFNTEQVTQQILLVHGISWTVVETDDFQVRFTMNILFTCYLCL